MKKLFTFITFIILVTTISAQNVGIGTNSPSPSALLHLNSTTKGLLIPSMTTSQRLAIANPANGLMVYDIDKNECYHYNGSMWRSILNGDYWLRAITNRDRIGNLTDSVGIGTFGPTQRLDVNGNIRSRDDVLADGKVVAAGIVSGSSLQTAGNLAVAGIGIVSGNFTTNGDVTTTGDIIVNNATGILQLRDGSNVNKGFFQLNTENIRIGTNVGNTLGSLVVRLNGNDRLIVYPSGDMDMDGNITRVAATGISPLLPVCYGSVSSTGVIISGTNNFSVVKGGLGEYRIDCPAIKGSSIIVATPLSVNRTIAAVAYSSYSSVNIFNPTSGDADGSFNFIVY